MLDKVKITLNLHVCPRIPTYMCLYRHLGKWSNRTQSRISLASSIIQLGRVYSRTQKCVSKTRCITRRSGKRCESVQGCTCWVTTCLVRLPTNLCVFFASPVKCVSRANASCRGLAHKVSPTSFLAHSALFLLLAIDSCSRVELRDGGPKFDRRRPGLRQLNHITQIHWRTLKSDQRKQLIW